MASNAPDLQPASSMDGSRQYSSSTAVGLGAAHVRPEDAYKDVPILKEPTWNREVAAYFYFGGISAGAAIIGSLADTFGGEEYAQLARIAHYISLGTLLPCPLFLIADLGMPARFHHMLRIFKPSSPMNLGSWALVTHSAGATVLVLDMLARDHRLPLLGPLLRRLPERLLAGLGIPSSLLLAGYTGVLLGTTSIPVWYASPLLGAVFMANSLSTGRAAITLANLLSANTDATKDAKLVPLGIVFAGTDLAVLMGYVATSGQARHALLSGEPGRLLAISVGLQTLAVGLDALLSRRPRSRWHAFASAASLASGALQRWAIVIAGHASARDREGTLAAMSPRSEVPGWVPPAAP